MGFSFRRALIASTALGLVLSSGQWAMAGEATPGQLPAVSGLNGKVDFTGADLNSENFWSASGSLSFPLTHSFGAQLDGMWADYSASPVWGVGGHAFWRDPDIGLLGIVGSRGDFFNGVIVNRYGLEGEYYLGPLTIAGSVGYQTGNTRHTGWGGLDLRWYPINNLMLEIGGSAISGERAGHIGFEWQPVPESASGLAIFSDASIGTSDYDHVMAGVRWYFGGTKPLQDRHRQDDPLNMLIQGTGSAVSGTAGKAIGGTRSSGGSSGGRSGASGPGGMGASCFIAGTEVLMDDGSIKAIEDVQIGEVLRGADGAANKVLAYDHPLLAGRKLYSMNGGTFFVTAEHPFMTKDGWKSIDPKATAEENADLKVEVLKPGNILITNNGQFVINSIESAEADPDMRVYNFRLSGNNTYFIRPAGMNSFLLVHNK